MPERVPIRWKVKDPFSPTRGLIRMSWNAMNLYNLHRRSRAEDLSRKSVFSTEMAYHVPNITETQLLARHWRNQLPLQQMSAKEAERTPPVQALAFGELERRLDVILFRAHFASSIWQARSFVTQGHVRVNGEKCKYPARRLGIGDMVTVNPKVIPMLQESSKLPEKEVSTEASPEASSKDASPVVEVKPETSSTTSETSTSTEAPATSVEAPIESTPTPVEASKPSDKTKFIPEKYDPKHPKSLPFREVPFMSPWMFTPSYLEVSYTVCSVILVRSPLPQPDTVEIPSPHPPDLHALAYECNLNQPLVVASQSVRLKPKFDSIVRTRITEERAAVWRERFEREQGERRARKEEIVKAAGKVGVAAAVETKGGQSASASV
ncbi:hypothetical protein BC829DRAFT_397317 [Chytridium lagenaria]|nr:hypothetical protein BC829DRAFT_397317 [Chytridium lagenaria]